MCDNKDPALVTRSHWAGVSGSESGQIVPQDSPCEPLRISPVQPEPPSTLNGAAVSETGLNRIATALERMVALLEQQPRAVPAAETAPNVALTSREGAPSGMNSTGCTESWVMMDCGHYPYCPDCKDSLQANRPSGVMRCPACASIVKKVMKLRKP